MQSNEPAILIQHKMLKKQIVPQEDNKNCQSNRRPVKSKVYADKKSQADKKCQTNVIMQSVKPQMDVQLKKPAKLQSSYKKRDKLNDMYEDKNCQDK